MGRVTEPSCKAALGKGLESKDQAVGSSDGHCRGQNSYWWEGNACQGRNTLLCVRSKSAWVPSLQDECCAGVDPPPISCRHLVIALLPPTHAMESMFNQLQA